MPGGGEIGYSVVVPVYNESESIVELADRIAVVFSKLDLNDNFEILFVDDGSTDGSSGIIESMTLERTHVRCITLRKNCGKSLALMAGFTHAQGACIVTMDGDLQDNPEDIPQLLEALDNGFDLVSGWRRNRKDSVIRRMGSRLFNSVAGRYTGLKLHDFNCGFKAYRRDVVDSICIYGQYHRYTPLLAHLLGFKVAEVEVENSERKYGVSKYKTFRYEGMFDLLSILFVYKYGESPLHFFGTVSAFFIIPSFSLLTFWSVRHGLWLLGFGDELMLFPRPLLSLSLTVLLLGVIIFLVGFLCDFILHHQVRTNMERHIALHVDRVSAPLVGNGESDADRKRSA